MKALARNRPQIAHERKTCVELQQSTAIITYIKVCYLWFKSYRCRKAVFIRHASLSGARCEGPLECMQTFDVGGKMLHINLFPLMDGKAAEEIEKRAGDGV